MANKSGTHWLAFYASAEPKGAPLEMFDCYGMSPELHAFTHLGTRINSSSVSYQSLDTSVCGHYCLFFIFHRAHSLSYASVEQILLSQLHCILSLCSTDAFISRFIDSLQWAYRIILPCTRFAHSQTCLKKCFACYF